jgi:hypothetical protein
MPAAQTYEPIATTTFGSAASSYTFNSVSSTYTDLVLVVYIPTNSTNDDIFMQFNSDTGSNYSATWLRGNGTAASSPRSTNLTGIRCSDLGSPTTTNASFIIIQIQNYSNTTTNKTVLTRANNAAGNGLDAFVGLWRSTAAINTIKVYPASGSMATGTTMTLYGIKAA